MRYSQVINFPPNPKEIMDEALSKSFNWWVDEKGTKDHPSVWRRQPSKLSYEEAYKIILNSKPLWGIHFRNISSISNMEDDYWEFGGCNLRNNDYGEVYIWIQVSVEEGNKIINKYKLRLSKCVSSK